MSVSDINIYGWIFLLSLALVVIGALAWYINRSMVELAARLERDEDAPKFNHLQQMLLPKYRAGYGRWANEEFHENVDQAARNPVARLALVPLFLGVLIQVCLWLYLSKFAEGPISFLNETI